MFFFFFFSLNCIYLARSCCVVVVSVVQLPCPVWFFVTLWTAAWQASLTFIISWSLLKLMSIELVMPSNHLILCPPHPLMPSIFLSIRVSSNESALYIRWSNYWSFSINPSIKHSGLISFRIDWFDLLAVQGTHKNFLQHHIIQFNSVTQSCLTPCDPIDYSMPGFPVHH